MKHLGIVIFACLTKEKYRQQAEDCFATWVQDALAANCVVRFYCNDIPEDLAEEMKALCVNVEFGDSYYSAHFKQWRGLEHMAFELEPCAWYFTCGTDTFLHVAEALKMLELYTTEPNGMRCIGGGKGCEEVNGESVEYFSGGAGIFLSGAAIEAISEILPEFMYTWLQTEMVYRTTPYKDNLVCTKTLFGASDLQAGVLCKRLGIEEISVGNERMNGDAKFADLADRIRTMISFHNLQHEDFYTSHTLIQKAL